MGSVSLAGSRVVLRDWHLDDLPGYQAWQEPGHAWQALDGPYYPRPTFEETKVFITKVGDRIRAGKWPTPRMVLVVACAETNALIGRVSRYWQSEETQWLSIGVVIYDPPQWGRGLGTEALGLYSDYAFASMPDIARLDLRTWSGNPGMMRVAEKLGYRQEACFRKARIVDGEYFDGLGYGILREEWREKYPSGFAAGLAGRDEGAPES